MGQMHPESRSPGWDSREGEYGGSSLRNHCSSQPTPSMAQPHHGQKQRLAEPPARSSIFHVCLSTCSWGSHICM